MKTINFRFENQSQAFQKAMSGTAAQVQRAIVIGSQQAANLIQDLGSKDIAAAGNFGSKWTSGLHSYFDPKTNVITVRHDIPFASVFEKGATIKGSPLLWLPLSFAGTAKASAFSGQLFRVDRLGGKPPLLLSIATKQPMFVGLTVVQIKKRFNLGAVIKQVMKELPKLIQQGMKGLR